MSLPAPSKPNHRAPTTKTQQLEHHLPSPSKSPQHETHETKHSSNHITIPIIFNQKFNTKYINWNELHYLAIIKGRIIHVQKLIQTHYRSYLTNYNPSNNTSLPNIPHLSSPIINFIHQILSETSIVLTAHNLLHCHTNWETQVDNYEGISVYYRQEDDSKNDIHSIKTCFTAKCHPVELIAVINEFDLMKEIVTICPMETIYLKQFTNLNKVIYSSIKMWWPLKNRDSVAHVRAYDLLNEYDEVLIWGKSFDTIDGVDIPVVPDGTKRMDVTMAEGAIKPIILDNGELGTEVISVFNIDFKTFIPKGILNWVTRTFAYYVCKMIRSRCENLEGTTHQKRIKEKEVYKEWTQEFTNWKMKKLAQCK
eukprot:95194_1